MFPMLLDKYLIDISNTIYLYRADQPENFIDLEVWPSIGIGYYILGLPLFYYWFRVPARNAWLAILRFFRKFRRIS
jgi:hypothetical protein